MLTITAQAIGLLAMTVSIISFQQKTQKRIVVMQAISSGLWTIHFLMLGAFTGGLLNLIAVARDLIFTQREKKPWTGSPLIVILVCIAALGIYALSFLVFGVTPTYFHLLIEIFPVIATLTHTLAMREKQAKRVRMWAFLSSPLWLTYNLINRSIGGCITEAFSIISIIIGYLRLDRKRKQA